MKKMYYLLVAMFGHLGSITIMLVLVVLLLWGLR